MKYKLLVKTNDKTFIKAVSKNKEHLEKRAIALSKKHKYWKCYVVRFDYQLEL